MHKVVRQDDATDDDSPKWEVADIFRLDYLHILIGRWQKLITLAQVALLVLTLLPSFILGTLYTLSWAVTLIPWIMMWPFRRCYMWLYPRAPLQRNHPTRQESARETDAAVSYRAAEYGEADEVDVEVETGKDDDITMATMPGTDVGAAVRSSHLQNERTPFRWHSLQWLVDERAYEPVRATTLAQITFVFLLSLLFIAYFALLFVGLAFVFIDESQYEKQVWQKKYLTAVPLAATLIGYVSPSSLRKGLFEVAEHYIGVVQYLTFGHCRDAIASQLALLVDRILERHEYKRIHIVSYSFGSIIAIDALFPPTNSFPPGFHKVKTLITVGCPFDMIRNFVPRYFNERRVNVRERRYHERLKWVNIYIPADALSSNFRLDGDQLGDPEVDVFGKYTGQVNSFFPRAGLPLKNVPCPAEAQILSNECSKFITCLFLYGIHAHSLYWGERVLSTNAATQTITAIFRRKDGRLNARKRDASAGDADYNDWAETRRWNEGTHWSLTGRFPATGATDQQNTVMSHWTGRFSRWS